MRRSSARASVLGRGGDAQRMYSEDAYVTKLLCFAAQDTEIVRSRLVAEHKVILQVG